MTIFQRQASTVYDRFNFTIQDVTYISSPSLVEYTPDDFFGFYDAIFAIGNETDFGLSTQYGFLLMLSGFLLFDQDNQIEYGGGNRALRLEEFLATPVAIFNNAWLNMTADNMGDSLSLVIPSFRVCPARFVLIIVGNSEIFIICIYGWEFDLHYLVLYHHGRLHISVDPCNISFH